MLEIAQERKKKQNLEIRKGIPPPAHLSTSFLPSVIDEIVVDVCVNLGKDPKVRGQSIRGLIDSDKDMTRKFDGDCASCQADLGKIDVARKEGSSDVEPSTPENQILNSQRGQWRRQLSVDHGP
jgi:hypothetical protein